MSVAPTETLRQLATGLRGFLEGMGHFLDAHEHWEAEALARADLGKDVVRLRDGVPDELPPELLKRLEEPPFDDYGKERDKFLQQWVQRCWEMAWERLEDAKRLVPRMAVG